MGLVLFLSDQHQMSPGKLKEGRIISSGWLRHVSVSLVKFAHLTNAFVVKLSYEHGGNVPEKCL